MRIPITKPVLDEADYESLRGPIESGWVVQGPKVREFEDKFARFTGAEDAIACTSCTTGLQLGLAALELGPGDEVIVPSFTSCSRRPGVPTTMWGQSFFSWSRCCLIGMPP